VLRDQTANRDAIVDYRWGLALGDQFLSEADLVELARAKVPLVRLRGRWVYLDEAQLTAGLTFLARGGSGQMTAGEAMRLSRLSSRQPLPVTAVDGSGWLADLLSGRAGERLALLDQPAALATTLRPYQRKGLSWLAFLDGLGVGALLADDMGLGKTVQLLALEAMLRERGPRPPTLIVCPMSVLGNWQREIERFTPTLKVSLHHGSDRGWDPAADLVLTTYNLVSRDIDLLSRTSWDRVVLDEAQHVKNSTSVTARAVRLLPARHRVALTGTPVENRLTELWSIMDFLNPGVLGPASTFRARYSVPIERYGDEAAAARLRRAVQPFLLRRLKTDTAVISDLPEKFERVQWCNLTVEQATLYRAVVDEMVAKLAEGRSGNQRKGLVLAAMTKLKQVCNHPAQLLGDGSPLSGRSGKIDRLEEILANALADGDRALVFTQFARLGAMLVPHLTRQLGTEVAFLHGGTPKGARDAMVERFASRGGPGVLLLSLKAGGTGLNLTAANHVVHLDRWWNPATEAQATDRAFRIGQRRDVQVHKFVCIGTIEERIDRMIAEKSDLAQVAVGSGEGWLTNLSTSDILELVELAPEAYGG
jgi:SNF2 family DNA or RNA helicase